MITNIIIGVAAFIAGGFVGCLYTCNGFIKVNKLYVQDTGNNFIEWVFDKSNDIRKHRIDKIYAAE
jgi:hypothetical protein